MKTFWRWAGTIFFLLVFIFLSITGIGTSLPIEHSEMCSAQISGPGSAVFDAVVDDARSVAWRPDVARVVLVSGYGTNAVWRETDSHGNTAMYATSLYGKSGLRRTIPFTPGMAFGGAWAYLIDQDGPGSTLVRIHEMGEVYNPFFRFMARYVFGYSGTMTRYLNDLGVHFGEKPTISCGPSTKT